MAPVFKIAGVSFIKTSNQSKLRHFASICRTQLTSNAAHGLISISFPLQADVFVIFRHLVSSSPITISLSYSYDYLGGFPRSRDNIFLDSKHFWTELATLRHYLSLVSLLQYVKSQRSYLLRILTACMNLFKLAAKVLFTHLKAFNRI